jgi:hypothetical protein
MSFARKLIWLMTKKLDGVLKSYKRLISNSVRTSQLRSITNLCHSYSSKFLRLLASNLSKPSMKKMRKIEFTLQPRIS